MTLMLGRYAGQKIRLTIDPEADPQEVLRHLLEEGIEVSVSSINRNGKQVRLGIRAPRELLVLREELARNPLLSD